MTNALRRYKSDATGLIGEFPEQMAQFFPDLQLVADESLEPAQDEVSGAASSAAPTPTKPGKADD